MPQLTGPALVAVGELTDVHTTQKNPLGMIQEDALGNAYIYLQGATGVAATDFVSYDEAFLVTELDTDALAIGPVAVALAAVIALTYGWFQIRGSAQGNAGTVADNGKVYATSTAGRCDDAAIASAQVVGAVWRSADATAVATVQLFNPWIGVTDAT